MERILGFIWRALTQNLGTKLISVGVAVVLWIVVLGSRNVEVTKEVPLEVIPPSGLVVSNEVPDRISFRLSGPKAFLRAILDRREEPIRVNLAGAKAGLVTYRFFSDNIRVPIGVKVLSVNPTAILIKLEALKRREIPVRPTLVGTPPEGFRIVKVEIRPPDVRIRGPETRVDELTEIATLPFDVSGLRQSIERPVGLELGREGLQIDGPTPRIFVGIAPLSANYRIRNVDIRVHASYRVRLEEKTVTVLVRAEPDALRSLDKNHVYAIVDLAGKRRGRYHAQVDVKLPADIGLVKVVPDRVWVTLY